MQFTAKGAKDAKDSDPSRRPLRARSAPASLRRPRCNANNRPLVYSRFMSTNLACVSWNAEMGLSNIIRVAA